VKPVAFWKVPEFVRGLYPGTIWNLNSDNREIYLTFDDGPAEDITPAVLDILEKYNAKASFFCIGRNVERHPDIFMKLKPAGHAVGNHSYSHVRGLYMNNGDYYDDIELASRFIDSSLFRPPYGLITPSQARVLSSKYKIIMWSVLSVDYDRTVPASTSLDHVIKNTTSGSIVVFHDSQKASGKMLKILPKYLEHFTSLGYSFNPVL